MKKNNLGKVGFLVLAVLLAIWLNHEESDTHGGSKPGEAARSSQDYLLAISWQPAFCEQRPNKAECRSQRNGRFDADHFSLHGLWPQPRYNTYCGVSDAIISTDKSGRWERLPKLDLSDGLRRELSRKMPGYRSSLHRHEWFKHGTCMPGFSPEEYFSVSLKLLDELNASAVRELFATNINRELSFGNLNHAFARAFGKGVQNRFILDCHRDAGRRIVHEIKLSLSGNLEQTIDLAELMAAAKTVGKSCPGGIVDPVGLQ